MERDQELQGRVVVITGASSGIGKGIAMTMAKESLDLKALVLCARRGDVLKSIVQELEDCYGDTTSTAFQPMPLDVTNEREVETVFQEIYRMYGSVDVLINCAGVMYFTLMKNLKQDQWRQTVEVNCIGTMNCCGSALRYMLDGETKTGSVLGDTRSAHSIEIEEGFLRERRKSGKCHIVNISSDAARQTFPALTVYNASKAFVHEFTKGLRCELVKTGVRVTEILPGDVRTGLVMNNDDKEAADKVGVGIGEVIGGKGFDFGNDADRCSVLDVEDVAASVMFALRAPRWVGVNEICVEPRDQMYGDPTAV